MLDKNTTYTLIENNSTKKLESDLITLLKRWRTKNYISPTTYKTSRPSDSIITRAYRLLKIYKPNVFLLD